MDAGGINVLLGMMMVMLNAFWLLLNLLMLPGNWMMLATAAVLAWWRWQTGMFSPWTLVAALVLALLGELLEFLGAAAGVAKAGGSRWAGAGAVLGGLVGAAVGALLIPIPAIGSLVGLCGGACLGAWTVEVMRGRDVRRSFQFGLAAGRGQLVAVLLKLTMGVAIWFVLAVAAFWP